MNNEQSNLNNSFETNDNNNNQILNNQFTPQNNNQPIQQNFQQSNVIEPIVSKPQQQNVEQPINSNIQQPTIVDSVVSNPQPEVVPVVPPAQPTINTSNNVVQQNVNTTHNYNNKKNKTKTIIIVILVIAAIIGFMFLSSFLKKKALYNEIYNQDNIDQVNLEMAEIIFEDYYDKEFNKDFIVEASYNEKTKTFKCKYVEKIYDRIQQDSVTISTTDFITYSFNSTKYEKKEGYDDLKPQNYASFYNSMSNEAKNKVLELAKQKGYEIKEIVPDSVFAKLLSLVLKNDKNDIEKVLKDNNYILTNQTFSSNQFKFYYKDKSNENNFITISSMDLDMSVNDLTCWEVYGIADKSISNQSKYSEFSEEYVTDYRIYAETDIEEFNKIYESLGQYGLEE